MVDDDFDPGCTRTLFVGNIEKTTTFSDLKEAFERYGEIVVSDKDIFDELIFFPRKSPSRWSNEVGKIMPTAGQFTRCSAFNESILFVSSPGWDSSPW